MISRIESSNRDSNLSEVQKTSIVNQVNASKKFFELRITLKIFGVTVLDYTWPPQKS